MTRHCLFLFLLLALYLCLSRTLFLRRNSPFVSHSFLYFIQFNQFSFLDTIKFCCCCCYYADNYCYGQFCDFYLYFWLKFFLFNFFSFAFYLISLTLLFYYHFSFVFLFVCNHHGRYCVHKKKAIELYIKHQQHSNNIKIKQKFNRKLQRSYSKGKKKTGILTSYDIAFS